MSKMRVLLVGATAAGAFAAASFIPAFAEEIDLSPVGTITVDGDPAGQTGHITADGDLAGTPGDGFITVGNDGVDGPANNVCADDNGDNANPRNTDADADIENPDGGTSPTCVGAP